MSDCPWCDAGSVANERGYHIRENGQREVCLNQPTVRSFAALKAVVDRAIGKESDSDQIIQGLCAQLSVMQAERDAAMRELGELLALMREAVEHCETCRGQKSCARCLTFTAALEKDDEP